MARYFTTNQLQCINKHALAQAILNKVVTPTRLWNRLVRYDINVVTIIIVIVISPLHHQGWGFNI
jgi:hypothetical protein